VGDRRGLFRLRVELAKHLGRVRGVAATTGRSSSAPAEATRSTCRPG
jgi:hypothetical protein